MINPKGLLQRLLENEIDFVLVGGLAATMYGVSTVTYDVDICFDFSRENVSRLLAALRDIHPRVRAQEKWVSLEELPPTQIAGLNNLYLQTDYGSLDLLGSLPEVGGFESVAAHTTEVTIFSMPCRVLDIETLIRIKEGMGRPKDRQVVLELKLILERKKHA